MNNEGLIKLREYIRKDKPKVLRKDFTLSKPLSWGWLLPYLMGLDDMTWERWNYWAETKLAGRLLERGIPQIEWATEHGEGSPGRKMLEHTLNSITKYGEWRGWSGAENLNYFFDWLLFGFGHNAQQEIPREPSGCEGASARLYQLFNLEPLIAYPHDYLGDIMAENSYGKHCGFYPTPMEVASMMTQMQMGNDGTGPDQDMRAKSVCDPALGTGRMLLCASNYSLRLYGMDINQTVIKACLVNGYLYAPWMVKAFDFLETYNEQGEATPHLQQQSPSIPLLPPATTADVGGQIEFTLV